MKIIFENKNEAVKLAGIDVFPSGVTLSVMSIAVPLKWGAYGGIHLSGGDGCRFLAVYRFEIGVCWRRSWRKSLRQRGERQPMVVVRKPLLPGEADLVSE